MQQLRKFEKNCKSIMTPIEANSLLQEEFENSISADATVLLDDYLKRQLDQSGRAALLELLLLTEAEVVHGDSEVAPVFLSEKYPHHANSIEKVFPLKKASSPDLSCSTYRVLSWIGTGRQGSVWHCIEENSGHKAVVKCSKNNMCHDNLREETQILRALSHASIPKYIDGFPDASVPFFVMEYCRGETVHFRKSRIDIKTECALKIAKQICDAVRYCHSRCVAHNDLSPLNIIIDPFDNIKIIDFGMATFDRFREAGISCGSPGFSPPEQLRGATPYDTQRADIFAVAAITYWLLTSNTVFAGNSEIEVSLNTTQNILCSNFEKSLTGFPRALRRELRSALAMNPRHRSETVAGLAKEIDGLFQFFTQSKTATVSWSYSISSLHLAVVSAVCFITVIRLRLNAANAPLNPPAIVMASTVAFGSQLGIQISDFSMRLVSRRSFLHPVKKWLGRLGYRIYRLNLNISLTNSIVLVTNKMFGPRKYGLVAFKRSIYAAAFSIWLFCISSDLTGNRFSIVDLLRLTGNQQAIYICVLAITVNTVTFFFYLWVGFFRASLIEGPFDSYRKIVGWLMTLTFWNILFFGSSALISATATWMLADTWQQFGLVPDRIASARLGYRIVCVNVGVALTGLVLPSIHALFLSLDFGRNSVMDLFFLPAEFLLRSRIVLMSILIVFWLFLAASAIH